MTFCPKCGTDYPSDYMLPSQHLCPTRTEGINVYTTPLGFVDCGRRPNTMPIRNLPVTVDPQPRRL